MSCFAGDVSSALGHAALAARSHQHAAHLKSPALENVIFWGDSQMRLNNSGRLFFSPFAILSMFTSDTFRTPRSTPL